MLELLRSIPQKSWVILSYFFGAGFFILSSAAGVIIIKSSSFSYEGRDTQITLSTEKLKKASNDAEYATQRLQEKIEALESKIERGEDVEQIKATVESLKPVANEIDKSNSLLKEGLNDVE